MARKITTNQAFVKAYINANDVQQEEVKKLLNSYLNSGNVTLNLIANKIGEILNAKYDRKKVAGLLKFLHFPKKEKKLEQSSRTSGVQKSLVAKHDKYAIAQIKKLNDLGCGINQFKEEWQNHSFLFFKEKYNLSEYNVSSIVQHLHLESRKLVKDYNDVINELSQYKFGYSDIYHFYITEDHNKDDLQKLISRLVGWEIGDKRIDNLLNSFNIKKNPRSIAFARGQRSRALLQANLKKLKRSGYTLQSLANKYENDHSLTKRAILKELNSTLTKNDQPFTARWLERNLDPLLSKTRLGSVSREELEFRNTLKKRYPELTMQTSVRTIIAPQEIDVYFPELKLGIEFNGDFWHSDKYMLPNHGMSAAAYHSQKLTACKQLGITLLFIWESDWTDSTDNILRSLDNYMITGHISNLFTQLDKEDNDLTITDD